MKIQSINNYNYVQKTNARKRNSSYGIQNIAFEAYSDSMYNALRKKMNNTTDVAKTIQDLFLQLRESSKIGNQNFYEAVKDWISSKPTFFIQEICKPIKEVNPVFRDLIFKSKDENISILKGSGDDEVIIVNFGKHGFFNNLFESEYAKNDMRLVFGSDEGTIELGTTKNGKISFEQYFKSGYWEKSLFGSGSGNKVSHKSGNASDTVIW